MTSFLTRRTRVPFHMVVFHDEVEIEDFVFDPATRVYTYPCPCGDKFTITEEELFDGEDVARCPSCSLIVRVIYDPDDFVPPPEQAAAEEPVAVAAA